MAKKGQIFTSNAGKRPKLQLIISKMAGNDRKLPKLSPHLCPARRLGLALISLEAEAVAEAVAEACCSLDVALSS